MGHKVTRLAYIFSNNENAIRYANSSDFRASIKSINIYFYYIKQVVKEGKVKVSYISTNNMLANGLTKPLALKKFT